MTVLLYWKSTCDTCRNARSLVRTLATDVTDRNYSKAPLSMEEMQSILSMVSLGDLINFRHTIAKARGWTRDSLPLREEFITAALGENNLLRRPITVKNGRAVVGFQTDALKTLLT